MEDLEGSAVVVGALVGAVLGALVGALEVEGAVLGTEDFLELDFLDFLPFMDLVGAVLGAVLGAVVGEATH